MTKFQQKILIGQILGDAHIEIIKKNCRVSFSFGNNFEIYALWIHSLLSPFCSNTVYPVNVKISKKVNYRLKTKTIEIFTEIHKIFYKYENGKYHKIVPDIIRSEICDIVLAHFIIGDGNYYKDGRVRIYTNGYSFKECNLLRDSIKFNCNIQCEVLFDRIGKNNEKQYIITIGKKELFKLQSVVKPYMHSTMLYRVGLRIPFF